MTDHPYWILRLWRRAGFRILAALGIFAGAVALVPSDRGGFGVDAGTGRGACNAPAALYRFTAQLPHLAARVAAGGPVTIVALGSSSTQGTGASRPENSYPSRLQVDLAGRLPGIRVSVLNRGIGGESASTTAARIGRDAIDVEPDLVIWQVGTNDVLRDQDTAQDGALIRDGVARLKAAEIDVILMDMQYAPTVVAHGGYRDMLHAISAAGFAEGVPVFHRFAMMQSWADGGFVPSSAMLASDRLHMNDRGYACLADLLADGIAAAARR